MEPYRAQPNRPIFKLLYLKFVEDVERQFQCDRCDNKLFEHYIANCGHKFCHNCKRLVGDGSGRWKCPQCDEYITKVDEQDVDFEKRFYELEVYCKNKNYGCDHKDKLKNIMDHITKCMITKDGALPVEIKTTAEIKNIWNTIIQLNQKIEDNKNDRDIDAIINKLKDRNEACPGCLAENMRMKNDFENLQVSIDEAKNTIDELKEKVNALTQSLEEIKRKQTNEMTSTKKKVDKINLEFKDQKFNIQTQTENNMYKFEKLSLSIDEIKKNQEINNGQVINNIKDLEAKITDHKDQNKLEISESKKQLEKLSVQQQEDTDRIYLQLDDHVISTKDLKDSLNNIRSEIRDIAEVKKELSYKVEECNHALDNLKSKLNSVENIVSFTEFQKEDNDTENEQNMLETHDLVYTWKIENIEQEMEENFKYCVSEIFPLPAYKCNARAKLELKNELISISLSLLNDNATGRVINLKIIPYVTFCLKDQKNYENMIKSITHLHNSKLRYGTSSYSVELGHKTSIIEDPRYVNDDSMTIEILIEPPSIARLVKSYNGSLMSKICNYFSKKESAKMELIEREPSSYFYTNRPGYRVQVIMWLNGCLDFKGKGISAVIYFLTGEFDEKISDSSFNHKTTFLIYNPKNLNKTLVKSVTNRIKGLKWYSIDVASHREIEDGGYVENDSLIYKVIIEPAQE